MSEIIRVRAPAKLNLALRVGPLGDDGFHPLATVFQTIAFGDSLFARVRESSGPSRGGEHAPLQLKVSGAEIPHDNTVFRAVDMLAAEMRAHGVEPAPLDMHLIKRVPQGAGLGGGSSDAVAALAACLRLWRLDRDLLEWHGVLLGIATEVGSDVPFFLVGGTALGTGRGVRVEPLDPLDPTWLVVAAPDIHVSTPEAYAAFDTAYAVNVAHTGSLPPVPEYRPQLDATWMGNDLAEPVCVAEPAIEDLRVRLETEGAAVAQMTGSGAAVFGSFPDRRAAARAAGRLRRDDVWAVATVSISGEQHRRAVFGPEADSNRWGV